MTQENTVLKSVDVTRPKRLPRYTSYPTALEFGPLDGKSHDKWLKSLPICEPISLYFHIPYCDKLCWFCGCFTTISNKYGPVEKFLEVLKQEIRQTAKKTGRLKVRHIHFGGGSPSILEPADFKSLIDVLSECYDIEDVPEFAIEIDPRTVDRDKIFAYASSGVNRVSLGIQDFNLKTQEAINRIQTVDLIEKTMKDFKDAGIERVNFDLIYGLPYQSIDTISETILTTLKFKPSRIALFGYAHVPHMKKHQKLVGEHELPTQKERQAQFNWASKMLTDNGYSAIGLDHFALPDDHLFTSFGQGKLKRNFQGYTDDTANSLIGFGPSAISNLPDGYAQNVPSIRDYIEKILSNKSSVVRGLNISNKDKMFRDVISTLMCYFEVDPVKIAMEHHIHYNFKIEIKNLMKLVEAGYMSREGNNFKINKKGMPYLRAIATVFDQYFDQNSSDIISRCVHESEG